MADPSSYANFEQVKTEDLSINIEVDFSKKILKGTVTYTLGVCSDTPILILDTRHLKVLEIRDTESGQVLEHKIGEADLIFGSPLEIKLPSSFIKKDKKVKPSITIDYETVAVAGTEEGTAMQWLEPAQTAGKKCPYLFTQCQSIYARSLLPCQDTPAVKGTYTAKVTVPNNLIAVMSAIKQEDELCPMADKKIFHFRQNIAIPSYLIALVVGALESRKIGPRTRVWCEKEIIDSAAFEFAETEKMLQATESIVGPYLWEVYDLVVLPPSFPFGGMENPCLTFVTPTLLAGDRSLANVIAHEISHSWTGNLVTNKTWEHFWLNEGFTVCLERKISAALYGEKQRQFEAIGGWKSLQDAVDLYGSDNPLTNLVPSLQGGVDPEDAFSSVPYEKGFAFLYYLETLVNGAENFDSFLLAYIERFKFRSVVTDEWKEFFLEHFHKQAKEGVFDCVEWDKWLHTPGMPPYTPKYDTTLADPCHKLADRWAEASVDDLDQFKPIDLDDFNGKQKQEFFNWLLQKPALSITHLETMESIYQMNAVQNSEIKFRWQRLCVKSCWENIFPFVVLFITEQGRMKFIRPLYRDLHACPKGKDLAVVTFTSHRDFYHVIAAKQIAKDLGIK